LRDDGNVVSLRSPSVRRRAVFRKPLRQHRGDRLDASDRRSENIGIDQDIHEFNDHSFS